MAKHILMLGIGGTGCRVASRFAELRKDDALVKVIAIDTASQELSQLENVTKLDLGQSALFGQIIDEFGRFTVDDNYLSLDLKNLSYIESLHSVHGSNSWRVKTNILFESYMNDPVKSQIFAEIIKNCLDKNDPEATYEMFFVSSIAGGTGSALILPLASYMKSYFKEKYDLPLTINSLLVLPDMYRDVLSNEIKTKAFANAYLVLREFNAYDVIKTSQKEDRESYFQLINKYNSDSKNPFDQIYLFDRIPGLGTIDLLEQIISDIINNMIDLEMKKIKKPNLENKSYDNYSAVSLTKIKYPKDRIIDYLCCQRTSDLLNTRYNKFMTTLINNIRLDHKSDSNGTVLSSIYFAKKLYELNKNYNFENNINENIYVDEAYDCDLYQHKSHGVVTEYYEKLKEEIPYLLDLKEYDYLKKEIKYYEQALKSKSRRKIHQAKKHLEEKKTKYLEDLKYIYEETFDFLNDSHFKLNERFVEKENMKDVVSFVNNLFYQDGVCLPGPIQMMRIASLYIKLYDDTFGFEILSRRNATTENELFDQKLLEVPNVFSSSISDENYTENGKKRLFNLLNGKHFDVINLQTVVGDLSLSLERIVEMNFLLYLKQFVEQYLNNYQHICFAFNRNLHSYQMVVKQVEELSTSDTGTIHYYHNSIEEKHQLYDRLVKEEIKDLHKVLKADDLIAREFLNLCENSIKRKNENEQVPIMPFIKNVEKYIHNNILKTNVGKIILDNSIIKLMIEDIQNGQLDDVKKIIRCLIDGVCLPVRVSKTSHDDKIIETKTLILSRHQADYLSENIYKLGINVGTMEENLRSFMFLVEQFSANIQVQEKVLDNELYTINAIDSLKLIQIDNVAEENKMGYYHYYQEAVRNATTKETPMWRSDLFLGKKVSFDLPFISPNKEEQYNQNVVKALVYCLINNEIKVKSYEETNKRILYIICNEEKVTLTINNKPIQFGEYDKLIRYFKENEYITSYYQEKFDERFINLKTILPFNTDKEEKTNIIKRIVKDNFYQLLKNNFYENYDTNELEMSLCKFAYELHSYGLIINQDFGSSAIAMITNLFYYLVDSPKTSDKEHSYILLGYLLSDFMKDYQKDTKRDTWLKEEIEKKLNAIIKGDCLNAILKLIYQTK